MQATEETLPATNEAPAALPPPQELVIRADALDARAAVRITDVLPPKAYEQLGQFVVSAEQEKILSEPLPADEVDIRPDDGAVYASHEYYRRKLIQAFGRMGWTLVPGSPLTQRPNTNEWYQRWTLYICGVYASEAIAARTYIENNARMDLSDVAESIKSDALRRCCKDLGIALECWNKRFCEKWKRENAIQVIAPVSVRGQTINKEVWRRRDADPFKGERPIPGQVEHQGKATSAPAPVVAAPTPPPPAPAPKPAPETSAETKPPAPPASPPPPPAKPEPAPAAPKPAPVSARKPALLDSQVRLLFARARKANLVTGEDATPMLEFLEKVAKVAPVVSDGKTSMENCHATFKSVPPARFNELIKLLESRAKEAQPEQPEVI